jgi:hypothetical protein
MFRSCEVEYFPASTGTENWPSSESRPSLENSSGNEGCRCVSITKKSATRRSAPKITRNVRPMTTMMESGIRMMDSQTAALAVQK